MNRTQLSKIINAINSILLPRVCFGCNAHLLDAEHVLCIDCRHDLPITGHNFLKENEVDRIFYGRSRIKKAASFLYFSPVGTVKNLLHHLKYRNQEFVGEFLGNWFGKTLKKQGDLSGIDYVIPVPLHPKKRRKRGYNQVDAFGERMATHLKAHFLEDALIKTANTRTLTKKDRLFRWKSSQNLYQLNPNYQLAGKKVLLLDDVITTGATIEACTKALNDVKNLEIYVATMAYVPKLGS